MTVHIICADVRDLPVLGPFHAILCDPPYHLYDPQGRPAGAPDGTRKDPFQRVKAGGFMGKTWDGGDVAFRPETWAALAALLHPGAFGMAFSGARTYHRMACAIEDAGMVLHSLVGWVYGSGFPKATRVNISDTQVDKVAKRVYNEAWKNISSNSANIADRLSLKNLIETGTCICASDFVAGSVAACTKDVTISSVNIAEKSLLDLADMCDATFIVAKSATSLPAKSNTSVTSAVLSLQETGLPPRKIAIIFVPVLVQTGSCKSVEITTEMGGVVQRIELGEPPFLSVTDSGVPPAKVASELRRTILSLLKSSPNCGTTSATEWPSATNVIITESMAGSLISNMADIARVRFEGHRYGLQALKPALEPICVFQVPYAGRPVDCITETGAGALWIDGARVGYEDGGTVASNPLLRKERGCKMGVGPDNNGSSWSIKPNGGEITVTPSGRWPSNLVLDEEGAKALGEQSGEISPSFRAGDRARYTRRGEFGWGMARDEGQSSKGGGYQDTGTAARFFTQVNWALEQAEPFCYMAKSSRRERDAGLEGFGLEANGTYEGRQDGSLGKITMRRNPHPTVKPIALARHLATLLLPPPEYAPRRILIPFAGVMSEAIGAALAGWEEVVAIEMNPEYCEIGAARVAHWVAQMQPPLL